MADDTQNLFDAAELLGAPVFRAAYSDRTAWLLSAMSELAYRQFEDEDQISILAAEFAELSNIRNIKSKLVDILSGSVGGGNEETLKKCLKCAGFDLIRTYNRSDTQAFMAKRDEGEDKGMLVLAFRGTERVMADFYSDVDAVLVPLYGEEEVHRGFLKAFRHVEDLIATDLAANPGLPVYITGHSLGGALAILATRLLVSSSQGACYTFGSPRVGTSKVDDQIKTPIYRVVNSADVVPRVPFSIGSKFSRKFKGYVHYGDMRYLTHVEPGIDDRFPGLKLHSNPAFLTRAWGVVGRWIATIFKAAGTDHSIALYRKKLRAYAIGRLKVGEVITLPETEVATPKYVEKKKKA